MATCDDIKIRFEIARGRSGGTAPQGLVASARFWRRNTALPPPWNRGFLVGLVADNGTGPLDIVITPHGEAPRRVTLDPGIIYLGVMEPTAGGFRTVRAHRLDVRPILGSQADAASIITREWQSLGAGDTPVVFWNIVEPSTRDQISSMSLSRGIRVRMLSPAGEQQLVGPATDCQWGTQQPAPPVDPTQPLPLPADLQTRSSSHAGRTAFLAGSLLALAVVGVWAWGSR